MKPATSGYQDQCSTSRATRVFNPNRTENLTRLQILRLRESYFRYALEHVAGMNKWCFVPTIWPYTASNYQSVRII